MIHLNISGGTAHDIQQQMIQFLAGASLAQGSAASSDTATTTTSTGRGRKPKATEPAAGGAAEGKPEEPSTGGATSSAGQSSAAADGPITKETLSPRVMALGTKAGPAAVTELFGEFGAKKFSEIPEDKYAALNARLDELLAA